MSLPRRKRGSEKGKLRAHCNSPVLVASFLILFILAWILMRTELKGASTPVVVSVGVLSACANFDRRAAVRATWGSSEAFHAVHFFLGICKNTRFVEKVVREQAMHGDIVMAPKTEAYEHIVYQTMHMMSVLSHDDRVTHVFKADDDSYVKADRLLGLFGRLARLHSGEQMLVGNIESVSAPIRDPNSKWCVVHGLTWLIHYGYI